MAVIILAALPDVQWVAIVLCEKELRMVTSKDTVWVFDTVAEYLRMPGAAGWKLSQGVKVSGQKAGRYWLSNRVVVENWLGHKGFQRGIH